MLIIWEQENISFSVVVLAGGEGTRLKPISDNRLKLFTPVAGKPFFYWFESNLNRLGFNDVIYLINEDEENSKFIYDNSIFNNVKVLTDGEKRFGTGGSINQNTQFLPQVFWIMYGDTLLNFDLNKCEEKFTSKKVDLLMTIIDKNLGKEFPNIEIDKNSETITTYKKNYDVEFNFIDYGSLLVNKNIFDKFEKNTTYDLSQILQKSISNERNTYEITKHRFYEMGNIDSFNELEKILIEKEKLDNLW